jgi:histidine triad (HIT) family protein
METLVVYGNYEGEGGIDCDWERLSAPPLKAGIYSLIVLYVRVTFMETNDFYCDQVFSGMTTVEKVEETQRVLAFFHTKPSYKVHIVIVPRTHVTRLADVEDMAIVKEIFEVAQKIILRLKLHETNYRIITNGGSFQDSQHLHFHLVSGDKLSTG